MALSDEEVARALVELEGWTGDRAAITRTVRLPGFPVAIAVVDRVAEAAEELNHHPDIDVRYATLTFRLSSHDVGGVTDRDLRLAARIDAIVEAAA